MRAIKVKIYPSKSQSELIEKHFGCCRFIYNYALNRKIEEYNKNKKSLSIYEIQKEITKLKKRKETEWLCEVSNYSLQQTTFNLETAFSRFFKKSSNFPKFKSKKNPKQSYRITADFRIDNMKKVFRIPKLGWISFKDKFDFKKEYDYRQLTVSKNSCGEYFVSVLYDNRKKTPEPKKVKFDKTLGIDFGMKMLITLSDGTKIDNPKFYEKYQNELGNAQKILSKKKKDGKNYFKQKKIVAKKYKKTSNGLKDYLHKLSNKLIENQNYDSFAMEHLDIQNMDVKHASQVGWNMLKQMMEYKCKENGKNLLTIGRYDPSSKTCSKCGNINTTLKLSDRQWKCSTCQTEHDRDINAANNIKLFATVRAEPLKT